MDWAGGALVFVLAGMLLALLAEFAVAPRIVARQNLPLWHGVGSGDVRAAVGCARWWCCGSARSRALCRRPS